MKKSKSLENIVTHEQVSVTIARRNQDISGKQTSDRTYCSVIKKVRQGMDESGNTSPKDLPVMKTGTQQQKRRKPTKMYAQMLLFPETT